MRLADDLLAAAREKWGTTVAVTDGVRSTTYAELDARATRLRYGLEAVGVSAGDNVALMLPNSVDFIATLFAVWRHGASVVPLSRQFRDHEIARYATAFDVRAVIADLRSIEVVSPHLRSVLPRCRVLSAESLASVATTGAASPIERAADGVAIYQFSSGTTGASKKIARTHHNLSLEAETVSEALRLSRSDVVLAAAPFYHAYGLTDALLAPLHAGSKIVIVEDFQVGTVLELIERESVTVFPGVPFMFGNIAQSSAPRDALRSLRWCISSGAPLDRATFDAFRSKYGVELRQQYGATELGAVAIHRAAEVGASWPSVGTPLANVDVEIWDENGARVPDGEVGEIAARSAMGAAAYVDAPAEVTQASFRKGFFGTGDLGRRDAEGNLHILGRKTLFINTATHKVDPREVEELLLAHESVSEVVVFGMPGAHGAQIVKAAVVAKGPVTPDELVAHCRGKIADYKIPILFDFRSSIPKSATGKIMRKYLMEAAPAEERASKVEAILASEAETERWVTDLLKRVVGVPSVPPAATFYELGGTSLSATNIVTVIEAELGISVPPVILASCTAGTLTRLVRALARGDARTLAIVQASREGSILTLQGEGEKDALYGVHPIMGLGVHYAGFAAALGKARPVKVFQDPQVFGQEPFESVERMANAYVTLLRSHRPSGPYHLMGYSFGAYVAFEMALLLAKENAMGAVILLDPPYWEGQWRMPIPGMELFDLITRFVRPNPDVRAFFEYALPDAFPAGTLTALSEADAASKALPVLFERYPRGLMHDVFEATGSRWFLSCLKSFLNNDFVASRYRAKETYDGEITIVATEHNGTVERWQQHSAHPLSVHRVPGAYHGNFLNPPHVAAVAGIVRDVLAARG